MESDGYGVNLAEFSQLFLEQIKIHKLWEATKHENETYHLQLSDMSSAVDVEVRKYFFELLISKFGEPQELPQEGFKLFLRKKLGTRVTMLVPNFFYDLYSYTKNMFIHFQIHSLFFSVRIELFEWQVSRLFFHLVVRFADLQCMFLLSCVYLTN